MRRLNGLTDGELVFQRDNLGPDMTTGGRGLLESVLGSEGLLHGAVAQKRDPQADSGNLRPGIDEGMVFIRLMPEVQADLNEPSKSDGQKDLVLPIADLLDQALAAAAALENRGKQWTCY